MPASLDQLGPMWPAGAVTVPGTPGEAPRPVTVTVSMKSEPLPGLRRRAALLGTLAATPAGATEELVPSGKACGRYVDWYSNG